MDYHPAIDSRGTFMKRLERLMNIALVLTARRRLRAADLADQFEITERTVYRDVRALQEAGFPVEGTAGDGYRVPLDAYLRALALSESETVALAMGAQLLAASADPTMRDDLAAATAKLESVLGPQARQRLRAFRRQIFVSPSARRPAGPLKRILESINDREALAIVYDAVNGPSTRREVEPLGLVRLQQSWLLVAFCRLRKDVRGFRIDRIRALRGTGETFVPRTGYSFAEVVDREQAKRGQATRAAS